MVRRTHIVLVDDIDGSEASETIVFGLDGVSYEIDLSPEHASELRKLIEPWSDNARRVGGRARRGRSAGSGYKPGETAAIRAWARENNLQVSDRGRVSEDIRAKYFAARED